MSQWVEAQGREAWDALTLEEQLSARFVNESGDEYPASLVNGVFRVPSLLDSPQCAMLANFGAKFRYKKEDQTEFPVHLRLSPLFLIDVADKRCPEVADLARQYPDDDWFLVRRPREEK